MKHNCQHCDYYSGDSESGECHRYPPHAQIDRDGSSDSVMVKCTFPMVRPEQWCGEWRHGFQDMASVEEDEE